ncbi:hypothetical protein ID866_8867 [Astraeus odoratus]|nr:hypothetical protein ID866_8867 [Astraeus odoratus]
MIFIVYKLAKVYGRGVFSSVGSSPVRSNVILTSYVQLTHWLTVFLQFTSFYIVASAAAWYDKRKTGVITPYSNSTLQDVAFVVIAVVCIYRIY